MNPKNATPQNFSRFGKVVKFPLGQPTSQAADYKFWSNITDYKINGETEIGICTVYKQPKDIITTVERHLNTPEILIPIDVPFLLPVLHPDDSESAAEIFYVSVGEAVVINNGVWHGPCLPAGKDAASYFVIFRKNTPSEDVQKKNIKSVEVGSYKS